MLAVPPTAEAAIEAEGISVAEFDNAIDSFNVLIEDEKLQNIN